MAMKIGNPGPHLGRTSTTPAPAPAPWPSYAEACKELEEAIDAARPMAAGKPPPSRAAMVIEESFANLQASIFGSGLDEESISAALMTALASACRMWEKYWLWDDQAPGKMCWIHYNKTSEAKIGADFALLIAAPDAVNAHEAAYRMVIVQAKAQANALKRLSIEQPNSWGTQYPPDTSANADLSLRVRLTSGPPSSDTDLRKPQYQLSRLLALRDRLRLPRDAAGNQAKADFLYAIWPDALAEPSYRTLEDAVADINANELRKQNNGKPDQDLVQSINIDPAAKLRHWLIQAATETGSGAMTLAQVKQLFQSVDELCTATVVLDLGRSGLGLDLVNSLNLKCAPALTPAPAAQPMQQATIQKQF